MESTRMNPLKRTMRIALFVVAVFPVLIFGITVTSHDKPIDAKLSTNFETNERQQKSFNSSLANTERQKRLLPYYNFYTVNALNQPSGQNNQNGQKYQFVVPNQQAYQNTYNNRGQLNQQQIKIQDGPLLYQTKEKYTPFLESNALPGPFLPMQRNPLESVDDGSQAPPQYQPPQQHHTKKLPPNYSAIYDKLSQLKLLQQTISSRPESFVQNLRINNNPKQVPPQKISYIPLREYQEPTNTLQYKPIQPTKTYVHTYTATNIDIPQGTNQQYIPQYKTIPKNLYKPYIKQVIDSPHQDHVKPISIEDQRQYIEDQQKFTETKTTLRKPIIILQPKQPIQIYQESPNDYNKQTVEKPIVYINSKGYTIPVIKTQLEQKYKTVPIENYQPAHKYQQVDYRPYQNDEYQNSEYQNVLTTAPPPAYIENPNSLSQILKKLQDTNALPQTLTPENIDNSIKTLVKILTALKKQPKFTKPIVVSEEDYENEAGVIEVGHSGEIPGGSVTQIFPANTPEGGTPGKAGIDYPALSTIPKTTFNCKTQRYKGFFGDPDTNCQVWHYCDLNGGQASFLCPNGTIFSQVALTCDWWYNVKCSSTAQLYVLNERLYKYILPLSPKFPEDYSGPLVDKYLTLKFKEMEEKMRRQKKGKQPKPEELITEDEDIIDEEAENLEHNETKKEIEETAELSSEETTSTSITDPDEK